MSSPPSHVLPKLVIIEGIMGSGKSTTVLEFAERLNAAGVPALGITEGVNPHPIRFDWDVPWAEMPAERLADASIARWKQYVAHALGSDQLSVVDGQLFHGNLTSLVLLEADMDLMRRYVSEVAAAIEPLHPFLIYFYQDDIEQAIRVVSAERGEAWVKYQVDWKLGSPYAARRGLSGFGGLVDLYRDYRQITDSLYEDLNIRKVRIENSARDWSKYGQMIDDCWRGEAPIGG